MRLHGGQAGARKPCPRCGGIEIRTLWLCGQAQRRHQCLMCGHRFVSTQVRLLATVNPRGDKFECLRSLPEPDRDNVEMLILLMLGTGTLVGSVSLTTSALSDLKAEHGEPSAVLRGFAFPAFSWLVDQAGRYASHFVAIDQGVQRVCFKMRRRRVCGPL